MAYNTEPNALRDAYDAFLAKIQRERTEGPALEEQSDDEGYDWMPDDDDGPDSMERMQDYLEYIILLSNCAAVRSAKGLPRMPCARGAPCAECRQHDVSYVPMVYWHTIPQALLQLHMDEYLRIRDDLPPWKSSRPGYDAPQNLQLSSLPPVFSISMEGLLRARMRHTTDLSVFILDPVQAAHAEAQWLAGKASKGCDTGLMGPLSRHSPKEEWNALFWPLHSRSISSSGSDLMPGSWVDGAGDAVVVEPDGPSLWSWMSGTSSPASPPSSRSDERAARHRGPDRSAQYTAVKSSLSRAEKRSSKDKKVRAPTASVPSLDTPTVSTDALGVGPGHRAGAATGSIAPAKTTSSDTAGAGQLKEHAAGRTKKPSTAPAKTAGSVSSVPSVSSVSSVSTSSASSVVAKWETSPAGPPRTDEPRGAPTVPSNLPVGPDSRIQLSSEPPAPVLVMQQVVDPPATQPAAQDAVAGASSPATSTRPIDSVLALQRERAETLIDAAFGKLTRRGNTGDHLSEDDLKDILLNFKDPRTRRRLAELAAADKYDDINSGKLVHAWYIEATNTREAAVKQLQEDIINAIRLVDRLGDTASFFVQARPEAMEGAKVLDATKEPELTTHKGRAVRCAGGNFELSFDIMVQVFRHGIAVRHVAEFTARKEARMKTERYRNMSVLKVRNALPPQSFVQVPVGTPENSQALESAQADALARYQARVAYCSRGLGLPRTPAFDTAVRDRAQLRGADAAAIKNVILAVEPSCPGLDDWARIFRTEYHVKDKIAAALVHAALSDLMDSPWAL
ncbi:hypothetical protein AURDEDRAFT_174780 [Auricularia subglabra TFB-10046 SS5]|uniref:Uncharacterized protein n=1 Tax=Auricularia subglabra (strain TFB-10046 / SS5) TaxID=717982 RepID=J0LFP2_AURST|nr:hypothetical protein AURDEDRAFT_174780 [Auricularia subglabra TFB-10046 SS5]